MSIFVFANNIRTTLASALSSSATTMTLASGSGLPTLQTGQVMPLTLNDAATGLVYETVYATAISGTSVTITRGQEGTIAASWLAGDYVSCDPTAWAIGQLGMGNNLFQPDQGNANAYVTKNPVPFTAFVDGMIAGIQVVNANTGASTFQTDGLAATPIYGKALQALQGGEIVAGAMLLQYRAALSAWVILVSPGGALQVGNATQSLQALNQATGDGRYVPLPALTYFNTSNSGNAYTATVSGITSLAQITQVPLVCHWNAANTGAATLNINGLGAIAVYGQNYQQLQGGELYGHSVLLYNGQNFLVLSPVSGGNLQVENATQSLHALNMATGDGRYVHQGGGANQQAGHTLYLGWDGTRTRIQVDSTDEGEFAMINDFGNSLASNGYQKLPGGLILQWGFGWILGPTAGSVTFPLTFPNGLFGVTAAYCDSGAQGAPVGIIWIYDISNTGFNIDSSSNSDARNAFWIATGY